MLLLVVSGCTWVYDAQYDDRAAELEAARTEFLPANDRVQFMTADRDRFYWVSLEKPLDEPLLHAVRPDPDPQIEMESRVTFEATRGQTDIAEFHFSNTYVLECDFNRANLYDAVNGIVATTDQASSVCAIDAGTTSYFLVNRELRRWDGTPTAPVTLMQLDDAGVGDGSIGGFGVLGGSPLLVEGGRLWRLDIGGKTAEWLENESPAQGLVVFDERGVLYDSNDGVKYTQFSDHATFSLEDAIADGGYRLSSQQPDIHLLADDGAYTLYGRYVIYRGQRGIFAYGLDTKKVTDLLLDRGESFETKPHYVFPTVTSNGSLFVLDKGFSSSDIGPVYRVELSDRLR
ncbi:MAG TPA: hypothetical protein VFQ53_42165 [Kofleriaceae bacterium]|nr:hypothetical protein [Kofleriaceae bacterium]